MVSYPEGAVVSQLEGAYQWIEAIQNVVDITDFTLEDHRIYLRPSQPLRIIVTVFQICTCFNELNLLNVIQHKTYFVGELYCQGYLVIYSCYYVCVYIIKLMS